MYKIYKNIIHKMNQKYWVFIPYNPYLCGSYISIKLLKLFEEYLKKCIFYSTHFSTIGTYIPYIIRDFIFAKLAVYTFFIFNILFYFTVGKIMPHDLHDYMVQ
jgi:hypothetical protein